MRLVHTTTNRPITKGDMVVFQGVGRMVQDVQPSIKGIWILRGRSTIHVKASEIGAIWEEDE